jgi:hypothetical protein
MSRIFAYGCSHTSGYALEGTPENPLPSRDRYSWAKILANLIDPKAKFYNYAKSGCSNKYIWHKILNQGILYNSDDLVVIMWTHENRYTKIESYDINHIDRGIIHIHPNSKEKWSKNFYQNMHSLVDCAFDFWLRFDHVSKYLPCKVIHTSAEKEKSIPRPTWVEGELHCPELWPTIYNETGDRAVDRSHMGINGHRLYAHKFYDYLKQHNLIRDKK